MEIGTSEWFNALNRVVKFPNTFAFYYLKEEKSVVTLILNSKAKVENIKYQDIAPNHAYISMGGALLAVERIENDVEYHEKYVKLYNRWILNESEEN